jgi:hypothetical protein
MRELLALRRGRRWATSSRFPSFQRKLDKRDADRPKGEPRDLSMSLLLSLLLLLLLPFQHQSIHSVSPQTRRAAHMDVRRFPTEPGWRVGKSPRTGTRGVSSDRGGAFLWLLSLAPSKKVTRLQAEAFAVAAAFEAKASDKQSQGLSA